MLGARSLGLLLLVVALLWPSFAKAEPTAAQKQTARELVFSGREKRSAGDFAGAIEDHKAAHALMQVPTTGYELGLSQERGGKLVEALDTLIGVGRIPVTPDENRAFLAARADAKRLAQAVAKRVPSVRLSLTGDDTEGATVAIDGVDVVTAALSAPIKVNPGRHEVLVRGPAGGEASQVVELAEGATVDVALQIDKPFAVTGDGRGDTIADGLVYGGLALAGVGVIVGSITGVLAAEKFAEVAPQCPDNSCPRDTHEDFDEGVTFGNVSTAFFVIGGIGLAAAIVGLVVPIGDEDTASVRIGPGGVAVSGRF